MIEPKPYRKRVAKRQICVWDCETNPFEEETKVKPFTCGFYDGCDYVDFWGEDCIHQMFRYIAANYNRDKLIIYAHNGGKFDIHFCHDYLDANQEPLWIGSRLVSAYFAGQEFRDSVAILPSPLETFVTASGEKGKIEYWKMKPEHREKHKREIRKYQKQDCVVLYEAVTRFHDTFGDRLTVGGTALATLNSFHGFETLSAQDDAVFRKAYFGGRVECFEVGVHEGAFQVFDVNSMYPSVMRDFLHPVSRDYVLRRGKVAGYSFARITARSDGALPAHEEDGTLSFPRSHKPREFFATVHEIEAGIETGLLTDVKFHWTYVFDKVTKFDAFVNEFYGRRLEAKAAGDAMLVEFWKYILNSSYGKFALNPEKFKTWAITDGEIPPIDYDEDGNAKFTWHHECDTANSKAIWYRPNPGKFGSFKNVATAASITGAARAQLLRGIALSQRPFYCDTDSIICTGRGNLDCDEKALGKWKLEVTGNRLAIAGKKMYVLFKDGEPVKVATKGNKMSWDEDRAKAKRERSDYVRRLASGEVLEFKIPIPHFKRDGSQRFIKRTMRQTGTVQLRTD